MWASQSGSLWSCTAHIITAVIGSGVLSLAWSTAQLGLIAGAVSLICFDIVTYVSAFLISNCYRCPDSITRRRNYFYADAVRVNLGSNSTNFFSFFFFFFFFFFIFFLVLKVLYNLQLRIYFTKIVMFYMPLIWYGESSGRTQAWFFGLLQNLSFYGTESDCLCYYYSNQYK